jgi:hypothetical protein
MAGLVAISSSFRGSKLEPLAFSPSRVYQRVLFEAVIQATAQVGSASA